MMMKKRLLKAALRNAQRETIHELQDLFLPWLTLSKEFAQGSYVRLFSPLTHLLAVSVSAYGRGFVPTDQ